MCTFRKPLGVLALVAAAVVVAAGSAVAGTIVGTPKNDVLRGTSAADKLYGKAGNDKLYGLAGNDTLVGGSGDDILVGGPGDDSLQCGPGRDTAVAARGDKVAADCELVKGLPKPALSIRDAADAEGKASLSFAVTLSAPSSQPVSAHFASADGTATAPGDYFAASGSVTFKPGETSRTISVGIANDSTVEPDETFAVALSDPVNATIANGSATGTIRNDDVAPRSGHYAGTTSQGKAISFDVAPDVKSVANVNTTFDVTCVEVPVALRNLPLDLTGVSIPLGSDWSFGFSVPVNDPEVSANFALRGVLSLSGPATGTLQVDLTVHNVPGVGDVHCSSGSVSWSAS